MHIPSPERNIWFGKQPLQHVSNAASASRYRTSHNQTRRPHFMTATPITKDDQSKHDLCTGLPKRRSWGSLRPTVYRSCEDSDHEAVSPKTVTHTSSIQSQGIESPISSNLETSWFNSLVSSSGPPGFKRMEDSRKGSNATVWPTSIQSRKPVVKDEPVKNHEALMKQIQGTQETWNIVDVYRNAKDIYNVGPRGEGQKLWKSYRKARELKRDHVEGSEVTRMNSVLSPMQEVQSSSTNIANGIYEVGPKGEGQKLWSSYKKAREVNRDLTEIKEITAMRTVPIPLQGVLRSSMEIKIGDVTPTKPVPQLISMRKTRHPLAGLAKHPPSRTVSVEMNQNSRRGKAVKPELPSRDPRKGSDVSSTSLELPLYIDPNIQQYINTAKPHLRVPHLQPAPRKKPQMTSKALPPVPGSQHSPKPRSRPVVNATPSKPETATHQTRSTSSRSAAPQWWKLAGSEMIPEFDMPYFQHTKSATDKPNAIKAKISRPKPVSGMSQTANIPTEMGGVGGLGTLRPLPKTMSERPKGSREAHLDLTFPKNWRNDMPTLAVARRQSKDSDASFACVGVAGPSRYSRREVVPDGDAAHCPSPLFSGARGGDMTGAFVGRDTKFYQPYVEVLSEYEEGLI